MLRALVLSHRNIHFLICMRTHRDWCINLLLLPSPSGPEGHESILIRPFWKQHESCLDRCLCTCLCCPSTSRQLWHTCLNPSGREARGGMRWCKIRSCIWGNASEDGHSCFCGQVVGGSWTGRSRSDSKYSFVNWGTHEAWLGSVCCCCSPSQPFCSAALTETFAQDERGETQRGLRCPKKSLTRFCEKKLRGQLPDHR